MSFLRHLEQCNTIIERFSYAFVLFFPQLFVTLHPETKHTIVFRMKERIRQILEENLPLADIDSQFLFAELSSLDITTIMMMLSEEYNISLDSKDVTPKNFMNVDSITALVERKLKG